MSKKESISLEGMVEQIRPNTSGAANERSYPRFFTFSFWNNLCAEYLGIGETEQNPVAVACFHPEHSTADTKSPKPESDEALLEDTGCIPCAPTGVYRDAALSPFYGLKEELERKKAEQRRIIGSFRDSINYLDVVLKPAQEAVLPELTQPFNKKRRYRDIILMYGRKLGAVGQRFYLYRNNTRMFFKNHPL